MEKTSTSQLPTALMLGNTVTTNKFTIIENFNKHFSTAGIAFHLATPTPVNSSEPPQQLAQASPFLLHAKPDSWCSERAAKSGPLQISRARQSGPSLSEMIHRNCCNPYYQPVQSLSYCLRSPKIGKLPRSSPLERGRHSRSKLLHMYIYPTRPF